VTTFAGAGIVADSDPDREWTELQLKYRPILDELS
jgi:menaquinone-specific isochorismate synthase